MRKILKTLVVLCCLYLQSNAQDCVLPSQLDLVVDQALKDEIISGGGEVDPGDITIRGGPYYTCLVQGTTNGTYQELSIIMEYTDNGGDKVGQFEMICVTSGGVTAFSRRTPSTLTLLSIGPGVTYDGSIGLWTNCSSCINTAGNDNNCVGCHPSCNIGLMRCTGSGSDDCCIAFDSNDECQGDFNFQCNGNPCGNGSTCTGLQDGFNCTCIEGFTGDSCETDIDECAQDPCQHGGTCMDQPGGYICLCAEGYTDDNCDTDIDDCESKPCMNGGTCNDLVAGYRCMCPPGITGNDCDIEINFCNETSCLYGGTCISLVDSFLCICPEGFTGDSCKTDIDECAQDVNLCEHEGTCMNQPGGYSCMCVEGYTDDNCSINIDDCASDPCENNGTCTDEIAAYNCTCIEGFTGNSCETDIDECAQNDICQHGGTCMNQPGGYICLCAEGYTSDNCDTDIDDCESKPCMNGGTCNDLVAGYSCRCPPGITGNDCDTEINHCNETSCLYGGTCISMVDGFLCICPEGYTGDNCETDIDECIGSPCQNAGTCIDQIAGYECICIDGFTDANCTTNIDDCASEPCQFGSTCIDQIDDYICVCTAGYTGRDCDTEVDECLNDCSLSEESLFDQSLCMFHCKLVQWREVMVQSGFTDLPEVEQIDEMASLEEQWRDAVRQYNLFQTEWAQILQGKGVYVAESAGLGDSILEYDNKLSAHQSNLDTWRDYIQVITGRDLSFQPIPMSSISEDSSQEEVMEVYNEYNEVWCDDLKTFVSEFDEST